MRATSDILDLLDLNVSSQESYLTILIYPNRLVSLCIRRVILHLYVQRDRTAWKWLFNKEQTLKNYRVQTNAPVTVFESWVFAPVGEMVES